MALPRMTEAGVGGALPSIDIAIRDLPRQFLERMAKIAESSRLFTVERRYDALGISGFHVLNLRYLGATVHEGFGGQLIAHEESKERIDVEMRAKCWTPDPPNYDCYSEAAKTTIGPLLAGYNRAHDTRYRLRVQSPRQLEAKLPPRSAKLFKKFAVLANTSSLHPLDWRRFYEFVRASRRQLYEEEISQLLVKEGFEKPYADRIATVYHHLCDFKSVR